MLTLFILGILFAQFFSPLIEEITDLFSTIITSWRGHFNLKIAKINQQIQDLNNPEVDTNVIGFMVDSEENEEWEEDD